MTEEEKRLQEASIGKNAWRKFGPYLSERQWGTVREDYSPNGNAWEYLSHDDAKSRAYRFGEDGIAGISDDQQKLCFAVSLWNGKDPILKERLFGLTGKQGNHGEDVKELYFYLDNVPTHSYMLYLYKYPQNEFPYKDLIDENQRRGKQDFEYELLDTKIFDENRYFDVFIEYAKASSDDILIQISVSNRGPSDAEITLLPTLWFRNTWSWAPTGKKPFLKAANENGFTKIQATNPDLGTYWLYAKDADDLLFTENETNTKKLFNIENATPFVKDAFHEYIVKKDLNAVNPDRIGTKSCFVFRKNIESGKTHVFQLLLTINGFLKDPFSDKFQAMIAQRKQEADAFYQKITPFDISEDMRNVQRQAFAGLLWNKQYYHYNVRKWLKGDLSCPKPPEERSFGRNSDWKHLDAADIFSMPDKWEYPWFASWDLAFHCLSFALIDPEFAKKQMLVLLQEWYMHPNGQIPAYEWSFGDVNPPVQAWAAMRIYQIESYRTGKKDRVFLEKMFHKLSLNFTWWVNRKDHFGRNIFSGGFLGLDNIAAFDRTSGAPQGGVLSQVDGTSWMGMYALNLLQIALELAVDNPVYEHMATKYFEHFLAIADAMNNIGDSKEGLWDEKNGFYFGRITMDDGRKIPITVHTIIGVIPLFAVATSDGSNTHPYPEYRKRFQWIVEHRPELIENILELNLFDINQPMLLSFASPDKLKTILKVVLDETKLLSSFGIRSVSKELQTTPYVLEVGGKKYTLDYEPAESTTNLFGGNSNWRGPVWIPLNYLLIESLQKFHYFLGDDFKIEHPAGSGQMKTLWEVSYDLSERLIKIFLKNEEGKRPLYGSLEKFQTDPYFKDLILFHEYFHGDNGSGLGASAQTGWTSLITKLIHQHAEYSVGGKSPQQIQKNRSGAL